MSQPVQKKKPPPRPPPPKFDQCHTRSQRDPKSKKPVRARYPDRPSLPKDGSPLFRPRLYISFFFPADSSHRASDQFLRVESGQARTLQYVSFYFEFIPSPVPVFRYERGFIFDRSQSSWLSDVHGSFQQRWGQRR